MHRLWRITWWTSAALLVLVAAFFLVSVRWTVFRMAQFGDAVGLKSGGVFVLWTSQAVRDDLVTRGMARDLEWQWHAGTRKTRVEWWPPVYFSRSTGRSAVSFRLWPVMLVLSVVVWIAHRRLRRFGPGQCPVCGYPREGLAHARCPECGLPLAPA